MMRPQNLVPREERAARPGCRGGRPLSLGTTWCSSRKCTGCNAGTLFGCQAPALSMRGLGCTPSWKGWDFPAGVMLGRASELEGCASVLDLKVLWGAPAPSDPSSTGRGLDEPTLLGQAEVGR